jgi:hypothetical protein
MESSLDSHGLTMSGALANDYTHTGDRPQVYTRRIGHGSENVNLEIVDWKEDPTRFYSTIDKLKLIEHQASGLLKIDSSTFAPKVTVNTWTSWV